ncbi:MULTISPECIES: hypothetical protein [unclassified Arthrobacter]|uniref:hypothetical protein n=1 Tax=unclassified Arthrobacter TaxID=235627 RepID=UPI0021068E01|nr:MULTISPECIES: hypothetical protein [unclassified Arthrobacter]MCQ1946494.1 hypothetical protein [Arthrobacter sp. zg-Y1116]MCQ1986434.1 hypothetical protein [Arthrobacter sp. zg-Y844]MCQ1993827.1 hypothetical protein [Arthrobacter sp. zg-Y1171]UWX82044.1 hypothetical protein N2L00_00930 [Arthrobacter sp. zg-Y1171]
MDEYVIVIETGYRRAAATHTITFTGAMSQAEATQLLLELMDGGHEELLVARPGTMVLEVSATEFLRVQEEMGGSVVMDRVTLTRKH